MIRDALGREFEFHRPPRRVVSLVPSLTETLFALGAGDAVAGIIFMFGYFSIVALKSFTMMFA